MRAKRSLGQNFLQDENVVVRIVNCLGLSESDTVIEIGPGLGALTESLLEQAGQVTAVEFDRDMVAVLTERFGGRDNFELVNADALDIEFAGLVRDRNPNNIKLVANLPYNISTPILQRLIEQRQIFSNLVLMFQREVVERIAAKPGNSERGFLSVLTENAFDIEYLFDVAPTAFKPVPKVWSAVVRLTPHLSRVVDEVLFREIVSRSFTQKRKTIFNNLKTSYKDAALILTGCGIEPKRRAETLTIEEWGKLTDEISRIQDEGASD